MRPFEIKNVSSHDYGKSTCEVDHNTTNNLNHEINLMDAIPPHRWGHRRAHSDDVITLQDGTIIDLNARDDSSSDDGIQSEPVSSDEPDDDSLPIPFNKQQGLSTSLALDLNSKTCASVADATDVMSAPPIENEDQHKQLMDVDHTEHARSDISSSNNGSRVVPVKRFVSAEKLAEIARVDPRRARRILSNRQSAARSKQRKIQYRMELERKVNALKLEAASLNARLVALQKQLEVVDAENLELKLKSQTIEQQVQLQEALNDAIRKEIEYMKILTRDIIPHSELAARIGFLGTRQN